MGERQAGLQQALMDRIEQRFSKKSEAASDLMAVLGLNGKDGAYRRMRGDTTLTPDEIHRIATHYHISLDEILTGNSNKISFSYNAYDHPIHSFYDYLQQIHRHLLAFSQQPGFRVFYSSREIPLFIYMMFPKVLTFKLYVYGLTTWRLPYLKDRPFSLDLLTQQELSIARATSALYATADSTDFWTRTILEQTLSQIEFMAQAGRMESSRTAMEVCREVKHTVQHAMAMAEAGRKFLPGQEPSSAHGNFDLFYNELAASNNTILATSNAHQGLYNTWDTPNFLYTTDQRVCQTMESWFNDLLRDSVSISVHSGRDRHAFFNQLESRVDQSLKRLEYIYA